VGTPGPLSGEPRRHAPLGSGSATAPAPPGLRVVLDVRPLQHPHRAPATATYLEGLLGAFDRAPIEGESFAFLLQSDLDDPTVRYERLSVVGRRLLPPTRLLGRGALLVDPLIVGGASIGAAWRAERGGAAGAVHHAAGGALPFLSRIPTVATLLDLAAWELPASYRSGTAARFGQRLRARLLRDAGAVLVGTEAVAVAARKLVRLRADRIHVVRLAPREAFRAAGDARLAGLAVPGIDPEAERQRLGLPERYFVYSGRYDARQDLPTLARALADLAAAGRPRRLAAEVSWPPRVLMVGATPEDRAAVARLADRHGIADALAYAPGLPPERLAALVAGARAAILPALSEATGLFAIEALACGTPLVASSVGALPEVVGAAGILVEPRDAARLAGALSAAWTDERLLNRLRAAAMERAHADRRTWDDVAAETRVIYAEAATRR
jgi:glycosyltransferase involved in cell wall biosynthesis